MASHRLSLLLLALGLLGAVARGGTEIGHFEIGSGIHEFDTPLEKIYSLLGPGEPTICFQLETSSPIEVQIGGCNKYISLGNLTSQIIPLNRTFIEKSLAYDQPEFCDWDVLPIRLRTTGQMAKGSYSFFKCTCERSFIPYRRPGYIYYTDTQCEPTKTTWEDRSKEIRFYHHYGKVKRHQIKMDHTIQAAIVNFQQTMCFNYKGDDHIKLTLSKCAETQNITIILNSDLTYSFSNKQKEILKTMHRETCKNNSENWSLDIETFGEEPVHGILNVFGCQRYMKEGETDDAGKAFKDILPNSGTNLDGINIYFDLKADSVGIYSADIKEYLDQVSVVKDQGVVLGVNITSSSPITVVLTRCKNNTIGGVVIADNVEEDYLSLNYTDLHKHRELSMTPVCDMTDEADALYLHIITSNSSGTGNICFSLDQTPEYKKPFSTISFPKVAFAMANDSVIVKKINVGTLFNDAFQSNRKVYFSLNANYPVSIFVSKCRYSRRELVAGEPSIGEHPMMNTVVNRITRATVHRCPLLEDVEQNEVYVHFHSTFGETFGTFGFFMSDKTYSSNPMFTDFKPLDPERIATHTNRPFEIATKDPNGEEPAEVDISVLVEKAYYDVDYNLQILINRNTPVTISFSKCHHHYHYAQSFNFTGGLHTVSHQDVTHLMGVMKRQQCTNVARDGIYLHISEPTAKDVVTIQLKSFRDSIPNNGGAYSAKEKESHIVKVPLAPMDHGIAIRVTNVHAKPVELSLTMCPSLPEATFDISNSLMTTAYIKLDLGHLHELKEKAANCTTPVDDTLQLTIRSKHAKGTLTIDRPEDEECDKWDCLVGSIAYFNNTAGLIIA